MLISLTTFETVGQRLMRRAVVLLLLCLSVPASVSGRVLAPILAGRESAAGVVREACHTATASHDAAVGQTGYLPLIIKLHEPGTELPEDVVEIHRRDEFVLAYVPYDRLHELDAIGCISRVEGGRVCRHDLDIARGYTSFPEVASGEELPQVYTGKGVVVGFSDAGFDPNHIAFRDPVSGESRVRLLTNYTIEPSENVRLDTPGAIAAWTTDDPDEWHATHVAGILAGGYAGNPYYGIATEADIVASTSPLYEATLLAGMEDVIGYAGRVGKPAVINMSVSTGIGPHDGTSLFCQYLERLSREAVICISAGNDGQKYGVWSCVFPSDCSVGIGTVDVPSWISAAIDGYIDIWSLDSSAFDFAAVICDRETQQVVARVPFPAVPEGNPEQDFVIASSQSVLDGLGVQAGEGMVSDELAKYMTGYFSLVTEVNPENNRFNGLVGIKASNFKEEDGSVSRKYLFCLEVTGRKGQSMVAYASDIVRFRAVDCFPEFARPGVDGVVNDFITGRGVIGVGAMCTRDIWPLVDGGEGTGKWTVDEMAGFSSYSESGTAGKLPDIVAPGAYLVSAISSPYLEAHPSDIALTSLAENVGGNDYHWISGCGTSMSSPYVAGVCSLWLQADPGLTAGEIKDIMLSTASAPVVDAGNPRWGRGILNSWAGLRQIVDKGMVDNVAVDIAPAGELAIYTLQGQLVSCQTTALQPGVYIVKSGAEVRKISVR